VRDGRDRRFRGRCCGHRKHLGERGTTGSGTTHQERQQERRKLYYSRTSPHHWRRIRPLVRRTIRPPRE
jgi:hypothetical protein